MVGDPEPARSPPAARPFPYRVEAILGAGGMGVVYRATDAAGQPVALKLLRATMGALAGERFAREAGVRIEHPNIVRILDAGTDPEGTSFIAFELLQGESLADRLLRGTLDVRQSAAIAAQVCRGLAAAHAQQIVHRDLKPANVFLTERDVVKVLDFGVARFGGSGATVTGQVLGTPAYLSPEQAAGLPDIDARSDVWAVGILLWECLLGVSPFDRGTSFPTLCAILMDEAPPLARRFPDVPPELARIVDRCLVKDRALRWPDATSLGAALEGLAEQQLPPVEAAPRAVDLGPLPAGEERVVAVLLARGVRDRVRVERAVRTRRGLPLAVLGDSVLGLFGAETWEGDEVLRAVGAALECRDAAEQVAVGSGRAGARGGALAGPAVRAAEDACRVSVLGVAVDDETGRAVRARFVVEPVDETLFEVIAERGDDDPELDGGATLVGRRAELARLQEVVDAARRGAGPRGALVTGPPGIGKTRLRVELERWVATLGPPVRVLSGGAESTQRDHALGLWAALLLRWARRDAKTRRGPRVDASAATTERRQAVLRLAREALPDAREARECADFLGELLGVPMPESPALQAARADPVLMADRLRLALLDLLGGLCARGPMVILLEDLHWADDASRRILPALLERPEAGSLAIVATTRADGAADGPLAGMLGRRGGAPSVHLALGELDAGEVALLARSVAGGSVTDSLSAALYARSGGNPLFVEETVRALHERGPGREGADEPWPLPLTVEAAVQTRLDALAPEEREVCKRAAVLGRPFRADEVVALGAPTAKGPYESLRRRRVLELGGPRAELRFAHALVAEICYRTVAPELRQELHRRAAALLEGGPSPEPAEVARHHELGGDDERAAGWWTRAAGDATRRGDSAGALSSAEHALRLGAPAARRFELHAIRADSCRFLGRSAETRDALEAALAAATRDDERARALTEQTAWLARAGRLEEARARSLLAVETARRGGDGDGLVLALVRAAEAATMSGLHAEARAALTEARGVGATSPAALAKIDAAGALAAVATGDLGEALRAYAAVLAQNRAAGDRRRAAANEQNLADLWNRVGAYAEAERALDAALEDCRRVGNRMIEPYVLVNLAYAQAHLGRGSDAWSTLSSAEPLVAASADARLRACFHHYRGRHLLDAGRPADARAQLAQAAEALAGARHPSWEVLVDAAVAACDLAEGRVDEAVVRSAEALRRRDELGALEEDEAEVFLVHARALDAAGRPADAALVRARGRARVAEIAARIEDAALRGRFLQDVPAHRALG